MSSSSLPPISVVMPIRNEERYLATAVARVLAQDYPGDLEVVLSVGPSTDRTAQIAAGLAAGDPRVRVVDNLTGRTPSGLNLAIAAARHDILVRVDGHGELTPGYLVTAVETLQRTGAANVGGLMDAQGETPFEQAVAVAYTSRLGLGGASFHLLDSPEGPAETVFLGTFRRDALERVGGFDETMLRAQDWELNHRLRAAGEQIWFTPRLRVRYRPRSSLRALARQFFETGRWRREVIRRYPETASLRYLAPPAAVAGATAGALVGLAGLVLRSRWATAALIAPLGYLSLITAGAAVLPRAMPLGVRLRLPLVLAVMHLSWGAGFVAGLGPTTGRLSSFEAGHSTLGAK